MNRKWRVISGCALLFGLINVLFGIGLLIGLPILIRALVYKTVRLERYEDGSMSELATQWSANSVGVDMQYWFFDVQNAADIMSIGAKPHVIERGPYGFIEITKTSELEFYGNTVRYAGNKTWTFSTQVSCKTCSSTDSITVPNIVYLFLVDFLKTLPTAAKVTAGIMLQAFGEEPFTKRNVLDLLYVGYKDRIIELITNLNKSAIIRPFITKLNISDLPDRVGFFYGNNGSIDGPYLFRTGVDDINKLGQINEWKNYTLLPEHWWRDKYARMLNGSDGSLYHPYLSKDERLYVFVASLCRSMYVTYETTVNHFGVDAYRYYLPVETFDSNLPENNGFCWPTNGVNYYSSQVGECLPPGLIDFQACRTGNPPVVTSMVHFLFSPKDVQQSVDGINPIRDMHETYVDIEPTLGIVMKAGRKIQLNVKMISDKDILGIRKMSPIIMPVLWLNESADIDEETGSRMYNSLVLPRRIATIVQWVTLTLGVAIIVVTIGVIWKMRQKH